MTSTPVREAPRAQAGPHPLEFLIELGRRARSADTLTALRFIAVNDSHLLAPYQQSVLWYRQGGVEALSGLTEVEANAPYVQWISQVCASLAPQPARFVTAADLSKELGADWSNWLPAHALWVPFHLGKQTEGGLLLVREFAWGEGERRLFVEWLGAWYCAHRALAQPSLSSVLLRSARKIPRFVIRRRILAAVLVAAIAACPVRLSVLTPAELVPAHPVVIRAPLDGVIKTFFVRSNEAVKAQQPLFAYDDAALASKREVVNEAWRTAELEERQFGQQALYDAKARGALSSAKGNVEEKRIEAEYVGDQLGRTRVLAPEDGIAFVDDPSEWIGRPVVMGQRVMRLAQPTDQEIEAWLPVSDAIVLPENARIRLYLTSSPLEPVSGQIRYVAYEASRRPDGHYAYRVRAILDGPSAHRVGLKGTARLTGGRVPLLYWILRRPWAAAREFLGV